MTRKIRLSVRHDIVNKAETKQDQRKLGSGWQNLELSVDELIDHIQSGYAIAHQFSRGHKTKEGFLSADLLIADIDNKNQVPHFELEDAINHPFISQHAAFLYTTPNHKPSHHRFRVIFILESRIFNGDSYEDLYDEMMQSVPTDPATRSCAQLFFGSKNCEVIRFDKILAEDKVNEMIASTKERRYKAAFPLEPEPITSNTIVKTKAGRNQEISGLPDNSSIYCPFGTHFDRNPSAFIKTNKQGARGVECRACGHSAWTEPLSLDYSQFSNFEQYVTKYAGKKNSHFNYQGFTLWDPEIEMDMGSENFHIINQEFLTLPNRLPGIHLVKSAKGTGKTEALISLIRDLKDPRKLKDAGLTLDRRVILVGHRQSLIRQSAQRLGLDCYLDTAAWDSKLVIYRDFHGRVTKVKSQKPHNYAICLDSLQSRINFSHEHYDVVIIDESEQVFSHFLSEYMDTPVQNFKVLSTLVRDAKYVFCLDADLDLITMTGVIACETGTATQHRLDEIKRREPRLQKLYFHLNTYQPEPGDIKVFKSKQHLLEDFRRSIQAGKRCFFVANSRKFVTEQYEIFRSAYKNKRFQLVTSDNTSDPDIKRFISNIRNEILNYDAVFASPSIGTGVDITFPDKAQLIDCVYGFFESDVNTHFDIDQQLYRVRHPKEVKVWVNPRTTRSRLSKPAIRRELYDTNEVPGLRYEIDVDGVSVPNSHIATHPFMELIVEVKHVQRRSMNNLKGNFINHRIKNGWTVTPIDKDPEFAKKGSTVAKAGRIIRRSSEKQRLLDARKLTLREQYQLQEKEKRNESISAEDKVALKRYWIEHFYRSEITSELIDFDNDGKTRSRIRLLEHVINSKIPYVSLKDIPTTLLGIPIGSKVNAGCDGKNAVVVTGLEFKKIVFLRELLSHSGVFDSQRLEFLLGYQYSTSALSNFVKFIKTNQETFEFIFGKTPNDHLDERPAAQVGSLLRMVELDHKPIKLNKGKKSGPSVYSIDASVYQNTMAVIEKRKRLMSGLENPQDE